LSERDGEQSMPGSDPGQAVDRRGVDRPAERVKRAATPISCQRTVAVVALAWKFEVRYRLPAERRADGTSNPPDLSREDLAHLTDVSITRCG